MIKLNIEDQRTISAYQKQVQKERGYNGPCFINMNRLLEIHEVGVLLASWSMINNAMDGNFKGFSI